MVCEHYVLECADCIYKGVFFRDFQIKPRYSVTRVATILEFYESLIAGSF